MSAGRRDLAALVFEGRAHAAYAGRDRYEVFRRRDRRTLRLGVVDGPVIERALQDGRAKLEDDWVVVAQMPARGAPGGAVSAVAAREARTRASALDRIIAVAPETERRRLAQGAAEFLRYVELRESSGVRGVRWDGVTVDSGRAAGSRAPLGHEQVEAGRRLARLEGLLGAEVMRDLGDLIVREHALSRLAVDRACSRAAVERRMRTALEALCDVLDGKMIRR